MRRQGGPREFPIYQVDAFTSAVFGGNPAAVCLLDAPLEERTMQAIAAEMNLSETAFLHSAEGKPIGKSKRFALRWFTPEVEVPLCGHATLATAAVLFRELGIGEDEVEFETKGGLLSARREHKGMLLDFPLNESEPFEPGNELLEAMGIDEFEDAAVSRDPRYVLVRLKDEEKLRSLAPDFERMKRMDMRETFIGVIATARGSPPYDFVSRFFGPWVGVNEDPVTGSAHTVLAPYWSRILGKSEMVAFQASKRGGVLTVRLPPGGRVELIGDAVTVLRGTLSLP